MATGKILYGEPTPPPVKAVFLTLSLDEACQLAALLAIVRDNKALSSVYLALVDDPVAINDEEYQARCSNLGSYVLVTNR